METVTLEPILRGLKRTPLFDFSQIAEVSFLQEAIQKIIPHRYPFLLIDKVVGLDLNNHFIKASRFISAEDPIFAGHFPDNPVYPGVLQIEMMAQCGLCLSYFVMNETNIISSKNKLIRAMITKLHHAAFQAPVLPESTLSILAKILTYDSMTGMIVGQIYNGSQLCAYSILEAYFNE